MDGYLGTFAGMDWRMVYAEFVDGMEEESENCEGL
jgi:hypothetical protein